MRYRSNDTKPITLRMQNLHFGFADAVRFAIRRTEHQMLAEVKDDPF